MIKLISFILSEFVPNETLHLFGTLSLVFYYSTYTCFTTTINSIFAVKEKQEKLKEISIGISITIGTTNFLILFSLV